MTTPVLPEEKQYLLYDTDDAMDRPKSPATNFLITD